VATDVAPGTDGEMLCPKCHSLHLAAAARVAEQDRQDKRTGWVVSLVAAGAVVGAFLMTGWFGVVLSPVICYAIAVFFGIAAGVVQGDSTAHRAVFAVSLSLTSAGALAATGWYIEDRSAVMNLELLLPLGLGSIPGALITILAVRFWK